jgi:hypothetical protein
MYISLECQASATLQRENIRAEISQYEEALRKP